MLADKTGTLTTNQMEFKSLLIGENSFGENKEPKNHLNSSIDLQRDETIVETLLEATDDGERLRNIMKCLALCHRAEFDHTFTLNSPFPEELTFLQFASLYGYKFQQPDEERGDVTFQIEELGNLNEYKLKAHFDFSSERKRMSIVVEQNGEIFMFTKGADEIIKEYLDDPLSEEAERLEESIQEANRRGLRTMTLGIKKIDQAEWENFHALYKQAEEGGQDVEEVARLQAELEKDLSLLGAICLEDKLQGGVGESVQFIKDAHIKFWVVTGDKGETAQSVAKSSGVISENMEIINFIDPNEIRETNFIQVDRRLKALSSNKKVACIVSGRFFTVVHDVKRTNLILYREFVDLLIKSDVAVFSRITSRQKQELVRMIREFNRNIVTLAIGDGANDVNMLNTANIGVGIRSMEGRQAARASDYTIGEFKHLIPLMFYYGRETYRKNSSLVLFNFYKNILVVMPQFWFGFFNFFSGQTLYETYSYQLFNVLYTFLPIFMFAIFDKSHKREKFLFAPGLYKTGHHNVFFNSYRFIINFVLTITISFYLMLAALSFFDWGGYENGFSYGFWNFGNMVMMAVVVLSNLKIITISKSYSTLLFLFIGVSIGMFFLVWFLLNYLIKSELYNTFFEVFEGRQFFLFLVVVLGLGVFDYLFNKLDIHFNIVKYEKDYQVSFDNNKLSHVDEFDKAQESYFNYVESRKQVEKEDNDIPKENVQGSFQKLDTVTDQDDESGDSFYTENSEIKD